MADFKELKKEKQELARRKKRSRKMKRIYNQREVLTLNLILYSIEHYVLPAVVEVLQKYDNKILEADILEDKKNG